MYTKKSAVDLTDLALGIVILGITVVIGSSILLNVRDNRLTDLSTVTVANESTYINNSADTLANTWFQSVSTCYSNVTGTGTLAANTSLASGNYTVTVSSLDGTATITNATSAVFPDAACTYTYYNTSEAQWNLPNQAAIGLSEYGNWFDIIVIVGIAGLILSLIFMAFANRGNSQGSVAY